VSKAFRSRLSTGPERHPHGVAADLDGAGDRPFLTSGPGMSKDPQPRCRPVVGWTNTPPHGRREGVDEAASLPYEPFLYLVDLVGAGYVLQTAGLQRTSVSSAGFSTDPPKRSISDLRRWW
jgi:hypothetical protein